MSKLHSPFRYRDARLLRAAVVCWFVALLCLVGVVRDCWAQERRSSVPLKAWSIALAGAAAGDIALSRAAVDGGGRELNPLYRGSTERMVAVKSATVGGVLVTAWSLRRTHPKLALGLLVGMTAAQVAVDVHNARVVFK